MAFQCIPMSALYMWKDLITLILLSLGDAEKPCVLTLVDDSVYEEEKELRLVLGSATSDSPYGASVGTMNETLIRIKDSADSKRERKHCSSLISFVYYMKVTLKCICQNWHGSRKFLHWFGRSIISAFSTFNASKMSTKIIKTMSHGCLCTVKVCLSHEYF